MKARMSRRRRSSAIVLVLAVLIALWSVVPIAWMVITSIKPQSAIRTTDLLAPFTPTLDSFAQLFSGANQAATFLLNSLIVTGVSTAVAVVLGTLAGYGLAHWRSRHTQGVAFWILSTRMAPIAAVIVPLFLMFRTVGLVNSTTGLIIAHLSFNLPFAIWLMTAFFRQVPASVTEAATLDGCSKQRTFTSIAVPIARPGIVTTAVLCAVFSWNDYAFASALGGPRSSTLPLAAGALVTQSGIDWGVLSALGVVVAAPMLIAGLAVRRHLVTGLSLGAVTGE
ncbi:carbohydrate ABC transporter permease [Pseudonocardia sp. CA-107938]|uniref:carbohydrate ABC transporter permease n=1 Tax=Pseudonocardia sp. CA-107938 TaxID=3240021 RepID=UPI003D8CDB4B